MTLLDILAHLFSVLLMLTIFFLLVLLSFAFCELIRRTYNQIHQPNEH